MLITLSILYALISGVVFKHLYNEYKQLDVPVDWMDYIVITLYSSIWPISVSIYKLILTKKDNKDA